MKEAATKHGHLAGYKKSAVYQSWCSMIARCHDATHKHYNRYGGNGITGQVEKLC